MTSPADPTAAPDYPYDSAGSAKNWLGIAAFITGALALSPVAIVLGHMGLKAVDRAQASNRPFALAGTVLGYFGLAATIGAVAVYMFVFGDAREAGTVDAHAQADVTEVGSEIALWWIDNSTPPTLVQGEGIYQVNTVTVDALLTGERTVTVTGNGPTTWCLMIEYEGGNEAAYSYLPASGLEPGAACEPDPEPSPSPTPEPTTSASPTPDA